MKLLKTLVAAAALAVSVSAFATPVLPGNETPLQTVINNLYTNAGMTENIALYAKIGYVEYARSAQHGHPRVFMRKMLRASPAD